MEPVLSQTQLKDILKNKKQVHYMSWKYVPFVGFFLFSALVAAIRVVTMPGLSLIVHAGWFAVHYLYLTCLWFAIRGIARFLDKKIPYTKSFSRRVFFQIMGSVVVLMSPLLILFLVLKPYWPPFFSKEFIGLVWVVQFGIIVLMNVGIAAGYFFANWQKTTREKARAEAEKKNIEMELLQAKQQQTEIEMRALRAQMNPHFIFNSLNSINKYILKNDHMNASRYLTRFAKLIRLILDNSNSKEVALSDELEALQLYIEMESLRFSNKFTYAVIVDEDVSVDTLQVPPLIIQPYVENAIWHGLLHKETGAHLAVSIKKTANYMLQCIVEDNGIGREKAREMKSKSANTNKSLGMKLTADRISMLNQNTSLNASIEIIDLNNASGEATGTKVILTIPI